MIDETYTPDSRFEEYLKNTILKKGTTGLPKPQSRAEELLWELCELISNSGGSTTPDIDEIYKYINDRIAKDTIHFDPVE